MSKLDWLVYWKNQTKWSNLYRRGISDHLFQRNAVHEFDYYLLQDKTQREVERWIERRNLPRAVVRVKWQDNVCLVYKTKNKYTEYRYYVYEDIR